MDARRAAVEQFDALNGCKRDTELGNRFRLVAAQLEFRSQGDRNSRAAHRGKTVDLLVIRDRHDTGNNGYGNAARAHSRDIIKVLLIVEKQLRDKETRAARDFSFDRLEIGMHAAGFGMFFRITRSADTEVEFAFEQADQIARVAKAAGMRDEVAAAGRIAAQCQNVADVRRFEFAKNCAQFIDIRTDTRNVRQHVDSEFILYALGDIDRARARRTAGTVGHRHIRGVERLERSDRLHERGDAGISFRRKKLEREKRRLRP